MAIQFSRGNSWEAVLNAEEFPLLEVVARERLLEDTAGWKSLSGCCGEL
jgi:hypothetical protein